MAKTTATTAPTATAYAKLIGRDELCSSVDEELDEGRGVEVIVEVEFGLADGNVVGVKEGVGETTGVEV